MQNVQLTLVQPTFAKYVHTTDLHTHIFEEKQTPTLSCPHRLCIIECHALHRGRAGEEGRYICVLYGDTCTPRVKLELRTTLRYVRYPSQIYT